MVRGPPVDRVGAELWRLARVGPVGASARPITIVVHVPRRHGSVTSSRATPGVTMVGPVPRRAVSVTMVVHVARRQVAGRTAR